MRRVLKGGSRIRLRGHFDRGGALIGLRLGSCSDLGSAWTGGSRVVLDEIAVAIDFPNDLVHADDALNLLFSLVLRSLWVIGATAKLLEVEVVVVGIWVAAECQRNEKAAAKLLLIVQYDQLSHQEANEEAHECQIRPLFKEIAWTSVHVNA